MIIYLYHKRHRTTGLNYFGKTTNNPYIYNGSGVYWRDHLNKHGIDIETLQVWEFSDIRECSKFAIEFSIQNNIVKSDQWANLCIENGLDGGDKFSCMPLEKLKFINTIKSKKQLDVWKKRSRETQSKNTSTQWKNIDPIKKQEIFNKISLTLKNKTPEQRENTLKKRRETESKRPFILCPHCKKVGKSVSNMKRYHLDNCKFILKQQ
jgi:hypothetical protein